MIKFASILFSFIAAVLGALVIKSSANHHLRWKNTGFLVKLLTANAIMAFIFGSVNVFYDVKKDSDYEKKIETLHNNLEQSLSKQKELSSQLYEVEDELRTTIEESKDREIQYLRSKELQQKRNWLSAFIAEKELNQKTLKYLATKLNTSDRRKFLNQPTYLKVNYLANLLHSPHTENEEQLRQLSLLYNKLIEINQKIKSSSEAVKTGNDFKVLTGVTTFWGVDKKANQAIKLYEGISNLY